MNVLERFRRKYDIEADDNEEMKADDFGEMEGDAAPVADPPAESGDAAAE